MMPPDEIHDDGVQHLGVWRRLTLWVSLNRAFVWLIILSIGLMAFLAWLPPYIRDFFWRGLQALRLLASIILGSSFIALLLLWSTSERMDTRAFLFFNTRGGRPAWLDMVMTGLTQTGNGIAALVLALALFFAGKRLLAYELVLGTLTLWLVVEFVKLLVKRGRPFTGLIEARIVGRRERGRSFPSGHTAQTFFIATLMAAYFRPNVWIVCLFFTIAVLVGITRMYVGAHYPRDVLAGAILGSAWGLLGAIIYGFGL